MVRCIDIPDFNFRFLVVTDMFPMDYIAYCHPITSGFIFLTGDYVAVSDFKLKI
jgi:hypothetical protein